MKTIKEVVLEKLSAEGKTIHAYPQYLRYAVDGYKKLEYFSVGSTTVNTVIIDVDPETNTAELPADYVDLVTIGIKHGNTIINLGSKDNLLLQLGYTECGIPVQNVSECCASAQPGIAVTASYTYTYQGWYYGQPFTFYGFTGGYSTAYYRIDLGMKRIVLDGVIATGQIVMEYLSNRAYESSLVHPYCELALKGYIDWQMKENRRNEPISSRQLAGQQWATLTRTAKLQMKSFTLYDFIKRMRRSNTPTIRL